jgi:hypothetical protein
MTISAQHSAPARLASAVAGASRGRIAYFVASGLDPAQARGEAIATIGRAVRHEALIGSADMFVLLGIALVLVLAIALGLRHAPYRETAGAGFAAIVASHLPHDRR